MGVMIPRVFFILIGLGLLPTAHSHAAFRAVKTTVIAGMTDADRDGVDDEIELQLGTDPELADTDGDRWDDLAELVHGTDPCDPRSHPRDLPTEVPVLGRPDPASRRLRVLELLSAGQAAGTPVRPDAGDGEGGFVRYHRPSKETNGMAVELRRSDLRAGGFLLLWRQRIGWNPLGIEQRYIVTIQRADGRVLAEWHTPVPVGAEWRYVGKPFTLHAADEGQPLNFSLRLIGDDEPDYSVADFAAVQAGLETDADRDGIIHPEERPAAGQAHHHWVNDDDDTGEYQSRGDWPARGREPADHGQPGIDGLRDLVDFFPVNLNLGAPVRLMRPEAGFRFFLRQSEGAAQIVPTFLTPASVGAIHRNPDLTVYGVDGTEPVGGAQVLIPDGMGRIELPARFLRHLEEKGHGVVLVEGTRPSRLPLTVEITHHGESVATLELPMVIAPVETMYRHVDICRAASDYAGPRSARGRPARRTQIGEPPGLPDGGQGEGWVVMIHGYNVPADEARGWHAETFKRLHALGGRARFVGVTWDGDTGLDYHRAVFQAFQSGDALATSLGFLDPARTLLIGHSLGNIVASQAVQAGFTPRRYFLLNAAIPLESLVGDVGLGDQAAQMTESLWRPYPRWLHAADWSRLPGQSAQRATYTWRDCFSKVRLNGGAVNGFSTGEEIANCPTSITSASVLATIAARRAIDYGVWKTQELSKGVSWTRSLATLAMERSQGGWGFNHAWRGRYVANGGRPRDGGHYERVSPDAAARIPADQLLARPFFRPFLESWLHARSDRLGSPLLEYRHVRYDLLARAIPAMSYAAGACAVPATAAGATIMNMDLEQAGRIPGRRWPTAGHGRPAAEGRWLHSDFKNVALPFVYPLFNSLIAADTLR